MTRIGTTTTVLMVLLASLAGTSVGAAEGQAYRGVVVTPAPGRQAGVLIEQCPGLLHTTTGFASGMSPHAMFEIDPWTQGMEFWVEPDLPADLSIGFSTPEGWVRFASDGFIEERGHVPEEATIAVVCLAVGPPTPFTYQAGSILAG